MNRTIISLLGALACLTPASALQLTVTPGSLADSDLTLRNTLDAELVLIGTASAQDLEQLKFISPAIKKLDLRRLEFPDGGVPQMMLIGSQVEQVYFPSSLKWIGESAFASSALTEVLIPSDVTRVDDRAFAACKNLKKVTISGAPLLGTGVFKDDTALSKVVFRENVSVIPACTFQNCHSLSEPVPATVTEIGAFAYYGTAISSLNLSGVSKVGDFAFAACPDLVELTVDYEHPMTIGKGAFFADSSVAELPFLYEFYPPLVMAGTGGDEILNINGASVDEGAFANNSKVKILRLGADVAAIKAHAFRNMASLETVNVTPLGTKIPETDALAFSGLENADGRYDILLHVKEQTSEAWRNHPVWRLFNIVDGGADVGSVPQSLLEVGVTRHAGIVTIKSSLPVEQVSVYTLDGKILYQATPMNESVVIEGLPEDEVLIVKLVSNGVVKVRKLK